MNRSLSTQLSSLALAAFATVCLMGGIQQLASLPTAPDTMASAAPADVAASQAVVVITGKRMAQG